MKYEQEFDYEPLLKEALSNTEVRIFTDEEEQKEDLL